MWDGPGHARHQQLVRDEDVPSGRTAYQEHLAYSTSSRQDVLASSAVCFTVLLRRPTITSELSYSEADERRGHTMKKIGSDGAI